MSKLGNSLAFELQLLPRGLRISVDRSAVPGNRVECTKRQGIPQYFKRQRNESYKGACQTQGTYWNSVDRFDNNQSVSVAATDIFLWRGGAGQGA